MAQHITTQQRRPPVQTGLPAPGTGTYGARPVGPYWSPNPTTGWEQQPPYQQPGFFGETQEELERNWMQRPQPRYGQALNPNMPNQPGYPYPGQGQAGGSPGQPGQPLQWNINQNWGAISPVHTPQDTQEAVNRAQAGASQNTLQMYLRQGMRPGMASRGMVGKVMPDYIASQLQGAMAAQAIPFQHAQANAQNQLAQERTRWNESLGLASNSLAAQNALNQYWLGGFGNLADFFRSLRPF